MNPNVNVGLIALWLAACVVVPTTRADVIVNDSWADGGRDDGPDALDSNWWTSASINGIEVSVGSLGLVTGTSGRGIHTIFPTQTLSNIGDKLVATYTFMTPATVTASGTANFRVGLFDTLGRAGLNADVLASSSSPNALYGWGTRATPPGPGTAGLPGYMLDMDAGLTGGADLNFREHDDGTVFPTGRLMGTTTAFTSISPSGPDGAYTIVANTTYTGSMSITRISATEFEVAGSLGAATHSVIDVFDSASFGMLAFWANANIFGASSTPGERNNGIDFSNVTIEFFPIAGDCPADIVTSATFRPPGDGQVDGADLAYMLGEWGAVPGGSPADIVTSATFEPPPDGVVDGADLAVLLGAWGACQ